MIVNLFVLINVGILCSSIDFCSQCVADQRRCQCSQSALGCNGDYGEVLFPRILCETADCDQDWPDNITTLFVTQYYFQSVPDRFITLNLTSVETFNISFTKCTFMTNVSEFAFERIFGGFTVLYIQETMLLQIPFQALINVEFNCNKGPLMIDLSKNQIADIEAGRPMFASFAV